MEQIRLDLLRGWIVVLLLMVVGLSQTPLAAPPASASSAMAGVAEMPWTPPKHGDSAWRSVAETSRPAVADRPGAGSGLAVAPTVAAQTTTTPAVSDNPAGTVAILLLAVLLIVLGAGGVLFMRRRV